jgi:hypothetical protein
LHVETISGTGILGYEFRHHILIFSSQLVLYDFHSYHNGKTIITLEKECEIQIIICKTFSEFSAKLTKSPSKESEYSFESFNVKRMI